MKIKIKTLLRKHYKNYENCENDDYENNGSMDI